MVVHVWRIFTVFLPLIRLFLSFLYISFPAVHKNFFFVKIFL